MHYKQVRNSQIGKEMVTSTLTSKGQVIIPKEIREHLKIHAGHRLEFRIASDGRVVVQSRSRDVRELKGIVRSSRRKPVSVEEMNKAIAQAFGGR